MHRPKRAAGARLWSRWASESARKGCIHDDCSAESDLNPRHSISSMGIAHGPLSCAKFLAMVDRMKNLFIILILLSVLMVGCSSGANQASSSPNDANANASPPVAQGAPPPTASSSQPAVATPLAPVPPPARPEANPAASAAAKPAAPANATKPGATATAGAPKLVLPSNNIDFGSVYQGKSLTRNLTVRNVGKADLNIESVVPS